MVGLRLPPIEEEGAKGLRLESGFLDRLIRAEAATAQLTLVTFEKAAASLPQTQILLATTQSGDREGS